MSGFGSQAYGSSPYGVGTPSTAPVGGGSLFRDTATGESTGSRRIDPVTRDYVLDEYGRALGMGDTQQLVFMALMTVQKSSAMRTLGQRFDTLDVIADNAEREVTTMVEEALADLIERRRIELVAVTFAKLHPGAVVVRVKWRDVSTQSEHLSEV